MGSFLEKPQTAKDVEADGNDELQYGLACMQGWRMEMEDAHTTVLSMPLESLKKWSFFAVYDGHAGSKVAKAASERLLNEILETEYFKNVLQNDENQAVSQNKYDCDKIKESIEQGFLRLDTKLFKEELASGSTAVGLLITPKHFFYINCGDSRACHIRNAQKGYDWKGLKSCQHPLYAEELAVSEGAPRLEQQRDMQNAPSQAQLDREREEAENDKKDDEPRTLEKNKYFVHFATKDHKPMDDEERNRIEAAGGMVIIQRINGALAVSRALGDFDYKRVDNLGQTEQLVSPLPIVTCFDKCDNNSKSSSSTQTTSDNNKNSIQDSYSIIACDGIYDAITNENLQKYVSYKLKNGESCERVSKDCLDLCLQLGSRDNMSIIVLAFAGGRPELDNDDNYLSIKSKTIDMLNSYKEKTPNFTDTIVDTNNGPNIDKFMEIVHEDMRTAGESGIFNDVHKFSVPGGSGSVGGLIQFKSFADEWLSENME